MRKTLAQRMKPDAFERKHSSEIQHTEKALEVLRSEIVLWGESNARILSYIDGLLDDVENGHGSLQEVKDEVKTLAHYVQNQNRQLAEIN